MSEWARKPQYFQAKSADLREKGGRALRKTESKSKIRNPESQIEKPPEVFPRRLRQARIWKRRCQ
jgi:hypothetical protein